MLYLSSLLSGPAYSMVMPFIENGVVSLPLAADMWDILDRSYEDQDKVGTALRELNNLRQGTRDFSAYFADFQRVQATLKWDDNAKQAALYTGMTEGLKDVLAHYALPTEFNDYVKEVQKVDARIRNRAAEKKPQATASSSYRRPAPTTPAPRATAPAPHPTQNPNYHGPAPMDLSAAARQTEKQRQYQERRASRACTSCGVMGHFRIDCPSRPARLAAYQAFLDTASAPDLQSGKE
jgi:hypothetical protein